MRTKKSIAAALLLTAGVAFAYEDVTDLTGATEPPKGEGDDSFVGDIRPGSIRAGEASDQRELSQDPQSTAPAGQTASFDELDADQDGNVSEYEARNNTELVEAFGEADADNDGVLSENELSEWEAQRSASDR